MWRLSRSGAMFRIAGAGAWFAFATALFGSPSQAQFYIGGEAGWTSLFDQPDTISGVTSAIARFNNGFNTGVRGGYEFGAWRFEVEYSYRQNGARDLVGSNFAIKAVGGDRHSNSIMTNVVYDFTLGYPITPHVGFGVGAADVFDGLMLQGIGQLFNNSNWQFSYQGIAGIRYELGQALTLDLGYRYFATIEPMFNIPRTSFRYGAYYKTNNFVASLIIGSYRQPRRRVRVPCPTRRHLFPRPRFFRNFSIGIAIVAPDRDTDPRLVMSRRLRCDVTVQDQILIASAGHDAIRSSFLIRRDRGRARNSLERDAPFRRQ
jgi:opacity protein-like surface antigen